MKATLYRLILGAFLIVLIGCSPLKPSQGILMGNYYSMVANYPNHFRKLNERVVKLSLESDDLNSALYPSDSLRVAALVEAINKYEEELNFPDSIAKDLELLDSYIGEYYTLIPNGFNIYKTLKSASVTVGGVFGLGSVANSVLPDNEVQITKVKKRKILAHFRRESENLHQSLGHLQFFIDHHLIPKIDYIDIRVKKDFQSLFHGKNGTVSSLDHYFNYNKSFINYSQKLILTRRLAVTVSESLGHAMAAENEVKRMTIERQRILKDSRHLQHLVNDLQKIKTLISETE
ncbi:MAG: hypothetical protein ABJF04_16025 [Reichenbachiella sp.]|uniref:hypothetical protein n=1 Tax=Reichenbachiella sp. TaxID=2184521 RepID=UPI0032668EC8